MTNKPGKYGARSTGSPLKEYKSFSMYKKTRSDYRYRTCVIEGLKVWIIYDENSGRCSVTNDIENVVAEIAAKEHVDPTEYIIFYRDSEGQFDGWDAGTEDFFYAGLQKEEDIPAFIKSKL